MIKTCTFFIVLYFFSVVSFSQNRAIDSLRNVLQTELSSQQKVDSYTALGMQFFKTQIYQDSAFYYTEKAYEIAHEQGMMIEQARTLFNLGRINSVLKRYQSSIDYYERSLKVTQVLGLKGSLSSIYNNTGASYFGMGAYKEAIFNYNKALYLSLEEGNSQRIAVDYMNIGEAEYMMGKLGASKEHFELSKKHLQSIKWEPSTFYLFYARTLHALNETDDAKRAAEKSLAISKREDDLFMISENSELLSEMEALNGAYGKAYDLYKAHVTLKDSLNIAREQNEIEKLKLNFELERTNKELSFVSKKNGYKNIIYALIGVGLFLLIFLASRQREMIKMTRQMKNAQTQLIGEKLEDRDMNKEQAF